MGRQWTSSPKTKPACTLSVANPNTLGSLIAAPDEITVAEAFILGDLDVDGDIFSVFSIVEHLLRRPRTLRQRVAEKMARSLFAIGNTLKHGVAHSSGRDRASIAHHYDQPVAFFEPWLGTSLVYSCAYFHAAEDSLDVAQKQKLEHVCHKLRLQPGERFLDIGCGWGSLLLYAACRKKPSSPDARRHVCALSGACAYIPVSKVRNHALKNCNQIRRA
jgi:cyclopropane-fatty-acyl-phospholipid synthase